MDQSAEVQSPSAQHKVDPEQVLPAGWPLVQLLEGFHAVVACAVEDTSAVVVHSSVEAYNLVVAHKLAIPLPQARWGIHGSIERLAPDYRSSLDYPLKANLFERLDQPLCE